MARAFRERIVVNYQPAAVGTHETKSVLAVKPGDRVLSVHILPLVLSNGASTAAIQIGDSAGLLSWLAKTDTRTGMTAGTYIDGVGAYTNQCGGKLYTTATTIDVMYGDATTIGNDPVTPGTSNPLIRVVIELERVQA